MGQLVWALTQIENIKKNKDIRKNDMENHKEHERVRGEGYLSAYKKLFDKLDNGESNPKQFV